MIQGEDEFMPYGQAPPEIRSRAVQNEFIISCAHDMVHKCY